MQNSSTLHSSSIIFTSQLLPDGSYIVHHSAQEIEVWGVNLSDHYTIRIAPTDEAKMDVVYLGSALSSLKH